MEELRREGKTIREIATAVGLKYEHVLSRKSPYCNAKAPMKRKNAPSKKLSACSIPAMMPYIFNFCPNYP